MVNMPKAPRAIWREPSAFAETHCRNCAAGWTRTGKDSGLLIVCLLDREPVLPDMVFCDRHEPKEAPAS